MNEKLNSIIKEIQKIYPNIKLTGSYSHNLLGIHVRKPNDLDFVISKEDFLKNFEKFKIENLEKYTEDYETEELGLIESKEFDSIKQIRCKFQNQQICIFFEDIIESEQFEDLIEIVNPEIAFNKKIEYFEKLESKENLTEYQQEILEKHQNDYLSYKVWRTQNIEKIKFNVLKSLIVLEPKLILTDNYSHYLLRIKDEDIEKNLEFYLSFEDFQKIEKDLRNKCGEFKSKLVYDKSFKESWDLKKNISRDFNYYGIDSNEFYIIKDFINDYENNYKSENFISQDKKPIHFECVINSIKIKIIFDNTIDFKIHKIKDFKIKILNPEVYFKNKQIEYLQEQINNLKGNKNSENLQKIKFEIIQYNSWKFYQKQNYFI